MFTMYEIDPRSAALPTDDALCRWAAGQPGGPSRVFTAGDAVAVTGPGLSRHDRLAVTGPSSDVAALLRQVLPDIGPTFRPFGDRELIDDVVAELPDMLRPAGTFGWMYRTEPAVPGEFPSGGAAWLPETAWDEVSALLDASFPASYALPGRAGVGERWAGARLPDGRLAAVAALSWNSATVGLVSGVATDPAARGRGLARAVCGLVVAEALGSYGTAGLMVDDSNAAALRLYRSLGLTYRPVRAAAAV